MSEPEVKLSWEDVENLTLRLARQIKERHQHYDVFMGIARGGMFPALLLAQYFEHGIALTCHLKRYEGKDESSDLPKIVAFPPPERLQRQRILLIDEVWHRGHSIIGARQAAEQCEPHLVHTAVLHFKPLQNQYPQAKPDYVVEETEAWIEYPWERFAAKVPDPTHSE